MINVLIADDAKDIRKYLKEEIESNSDDIHIIETVSSGAQAVEASRQLHPQVVLMDIQMEYMTAGIDAVEQIRKEMPDIKCIMLSIHENDDYFFRAYIAGAMDYIVKSAQPKDIVNSIHAVMENKLLLRPQTAKRIVEEYNLIKEQENQLKACLKTVMTLSSSEYEILNMVYNGYTYRDIASQRFVQEVTIRTQVNHILKKFNKSRMRQVIDLLREVRFFENI